MATLSHLSLLALLVTCVSAADYTAVNNLITTLADANLIAGIGYVTEGGIETWSKAFGNVIPGFKVPFDTTMRYGVGSHAKGMAGVAIYQLEARGLLNATDLISKYIKPEDFGLPTNFTWCLQLLNETTGQKYGPCYMPKINELLSHQSGLIDNALHCRYPSSTLPAWPADYCWGGPKGYTMPINEASWLAQGARPLSQYIMTTGLFDYPLAFAPGTNYDDNNNNFVIAAYIVEQISGMPYQLYLQKYLFDAANMTDTYIDTANFNDGLYKNTVPRPGYKSLISPMSLGMSMLDYPILGDAAVQRGDVYNTTADPEGPPYGTYRKTVSYLDPVVTTFGMEVAIAGVAVTSTVRDMATYYRVLTRNPAQIGLTNATLKTLLTYGRPYNGFLMAQGMVTNLPDANLTAPPYIHFVFYSGEFGYPVIQYTELGADASKDVSVGLLLHTVPYIDFFTIGYDTAGPASPTPPSDPMNPRFQNRTCLMSVNEQDSWYTPTYGWASGLPARSKEGFQHFLAKAAAAGSPIVNGTVPIPSFYCEAAAQHNSLTYYIASMLAGVALGHPWYLPH